MQSFLQNYTCPILISIFIILSTNSCSDAGIDPGKPSFTGITETNETGQVLSVDPGDWSCVDSLACPDSPDSTNIHVLPSKFRFGPAFPNPTNGRTSICMAFPISTRATIIVFDGGSFTDTLFNQAFAAGQYVFEWNGESLPKKIYRFTISTNDWNSYGDVELR